MPTDFSAQIINWISAVQYRTVTSSNALVVSVNAALNSGSTTAQGQLLVENDPYTTNVVDAVIREYQAAFGRVPDQAGASYWTGSLFSQFGSSAPLSVNALNTIATTFANSPEFGARFGGATANTPTMGNTTLVMSLYTNVLGRAPDPAGLAYWLGQPLTAAQLLSAFSQSPEFVAAVSPNIYGYQNLEIAGTPPTSGSLFAVPGAGSFTLTLNTDTFTSNGTNDVFNAPLIFNSGTATQVQSLQPGDSITETGTGAVLNATFNNAASANITGVTISGVQTYNLTNIGAAGETLSGNLTGVTVINNVGSTTAIGVGTTGGLATALTGIGVSNTSAATVVAFTAGALAGNNESLAVTVNNAGTSSTVTETVLAAVLGGATANGYETFALNETGTNFVALRGATALVNTTNTVTFAGAGTITVFGDGTAGDFSKITTVDASAATGAVTVTGALTGATGLLTGDTALTMVKGGSGNDVIDISSMSLANFTGNNTTVNLGGGTNKLIVSSSLADTTSALSSISNVQVLGIAAATGTMDMSKLPSSIATVQLGSAQAGNLTINNGPSNFTFDEQNFAINTSFSNTGLTINSAGSGTGNILNLIYGTSTASVSADIQKEVGYGVVNISSVGPSNSVDQLSATAAVGGTETVNISGAGNLIFQAPAAGEALFTFGITTTVNITNSGITTIATPTNTGSTNSQIVNASTSGGLIMGGIETGNSGNTGVNVTGSAVAGKGNVLDGSNGNDALTGGSFKDTIATNGGGDNITLLAGHGSDHIELYKVNNSATNLTPGSVQGATTGSVVAAGDVASAGFWGIPGGGSNATSIFVLFATGGTSADQSTVSGFVAGSGAGADTLDISISSFSPGATHIGLANVDGSKVTTAGNAVITSVSSGGTLAGSTVDLVVVNGATFANASALATALKTGTFALQFSAAQNPANWEHLIFAYNDASGNAHIADVAVNNTASTAFAGQFQVIASDMVQLTGVSASALTGNNVSFVA